MALTANVVIHIGNFDTVCSLQFAELETGGRSRNLRSVNFSSKWGKHWATLLHWEQRSVGKCDACTAGLSSVKERLDLSPWTPIPAVSYCQKACGASTCKCQIFEINYCRYLCCACYSVDYDESRGSQVALTLWMCTGLTWSEMIRWLSTAQGVPEIHSFVARCGDTYPQWQHSGGPGRLNIK